MESGNTLLIMCITLYLVWWSITFNPNKNFPALPKVSLFILFTLLGIIGLFLIIKGVVEAKIEYKRGRFSNSLIALLGGVLYILLVVITKLVLKRPLTTELLLITLLTTLTTLSINALYRSCVFNIAFLLIALIILTLTFILSLAVYILYYKLEENKAFIVAMLPLVAFNLTLCTQNILLLFSKK